MERGLDNKNRITKTGELPREITKKLRSSKEINRNGKESHKEKI